MATNEILEFAEDATGADILSQAAYAADTDRLDGHQVGIARQELENKVLRQVSLVSSALAQFIADSQSNNVVDSIDAATLAGYLTTALRGFNVPAVAAGGTADVMTATFSPAVTLTNGLIVVVRAVGANTVVAPTLNANGAGGVAIVKDNNTALRVGDISGAAHWMVLVYSSTLTKYILVNPAFNPATQSEVNAGAIDTAPVTPLKLATYNAQILHVRDEKAAGTDGGTFASGAWETRTLNTVVTNNITGASLGGNQITLPAGSYVVDATAPTDFVGNNKLRLRNITDGSDALNGTSCTDGDSGGGVAILRGLLTLAGTKVLELQHRCSAGQPTTGFGEASGWSTIEIYADVMIRKI